MKERIFHRISPCDRGLFADDTPRAARARELTRYLHRVRRPCPPCGRIPATMVQAPRIFMQAPAEKFSAPAQPRLPEIQASLAPGDLDLLGAQPAHEGAELALGLGLGALHHVGARSHLLDGFDGLAPRLALELLVAARERARRAREDVG